MKTLQWLAAVVLVVAGIVLLVKPMRAHAEGAGVMSSHCVVSVKPQVNVVVVEF